MGTHRATSETDVVIGSNLRRLRISRSMSLASLAESLGVTFQQIQKYETGLNRIAVSTLIDMCRSLECEFQDFVVGLDMGEGVKAAPQEFSRKAVSVANSIDGISNPEVQNALVRLMSSIKGN